MKINESKPYQETIVDGKSNRVFTESVDEGELQWHRDREDRVVKIIESDGWSLQLDNELPKELIIGEEYFIPQGIYHRVIRGHGDLKIEVTFL